MLDHAIAFYHAVLTASNAGKPALDYLHGRGFTDETIAGAPARLGARRLGPDDPDPRRQARRPPRGAASRSGSPRRGRAAGAASTTSSARASSSRSATRTATRSASVGGCSKATGPKYLNSPATPLFDKSRTLYLIDKAKGPIRKTGQAVIVEGYTDALMAHQAGFDNVVASLGTALTPGQVALLTRYASRIVARLRRRPGRREGRHARRDRPGRAHRPAPGGHVRRQARGRARRAAARRQGPRRGRPRVAGGVGGGDRQGQAARRVPDRPSRRPLRPQDQLGPDRLRRGGHAGAPRHRRPAASRRGARRGPPRVGRRGARAPPGPGAPARIRFAQGRSAGAGRAPAGESPDHRRRRPRVAGRAADPRHPAGDHPGRGGAAAAPAARAGPAAPGRR